MSLLETLKTNQLTARKAKDAVATSLLTTLIGESTKVSDEDFKKGQTEITDEKVIATMKKFLKNAEETARLLQGKSSEHLATVQTEIAILNEYLPQQMSEEQLATAIKLFKDANPDANMGAIMGHLKANYAGLYDGKLASQLAKG
jgi:uncharacterized protein YqeY